MGNISVPRDKKCFQVNAKRQEPAGAEDFGLHGLPTYLFEVPKNEASVSSRCK